RQHTAAIEMDIVRGDAQRAAVRHRVARVYGDIDQCKLQFADVHLYRPSDGVDVDVQLHRTTHRADKQVAEKVQSLLEIDAFTVQSLPSRKAQKLARQIRAVRRCLFDSVKRTNIFRIFHAHAH